ncbi:MAG: hypothetical protein JNK15_05330 [Planctomycetes bacterium]|nr:hypothetical protein [Planctomycetota bacterium]
MRRTAALVALLLSSGCTVALWRSDGFEPPPQNRPTAIEAAAITTDGQLWVRCSFASPWCKNVVAPLDWRAQPAVARATGQPLPNTTCPVHVCQPGELDELLRLHPDRDAHGLEPALWVELETAAGAGPQLWVLDSRGRLRGQRVMLPSSGVDWLSPATAPHILVTPVAVAVDVVLTPVWLVLVGLFASGVGTR